MRSKTYLVLSLGIRYWSSTAGTKLAKIQHNDAAKITPAYAKLFIFTLRLELNSEKGARCAHDS